jgi:hypothetical protein
MWIAYFFVLALQIYEFIYRLPVPLMELNQRIAAFVQLGNFFRTFEKKGEWPGYSSGISQTDFQVFNELIGYVHHHNGWFTEEMVRKALGAWGRNLTEEKMREWLDRYSLPESGSGQKTIAIIMAGNIPLVGFHDLLSVLITGNKALVKFSSDDDRLMPSVIGYLIRYIEPRFENCIRIASGKLENFDAIIATGSDNSSRYFEYYFGKYPGIIRKNRTSVALIDGDETEEELNKLGHDIFDFYGLGCRNVTKILVPDNFDLDRFFGAIFSFREIINHNKYANNYDYNKAIYLLNRFDLLENGFILLKEEKELHSPIGVMFYQRFKSKAEMNEYISNHREKIQCVVGHDHIAFGDSQKPELWDYADGIDTIHFITKEVSVGNPA